MNDVPWRLVCTDCGTSYPGLESRYRCDCFGTLDVNHDFRRFRLPSLSVLDARLASRTPIDRSGVWRFREFILPLPTEHIVTRREGNTNLYDAPSVARYTGVEQLFLKHEGENPTGSFVDRGMSVAMSVARQLGATRVACASTGNTSASMASYAAVAGMRAFAFVPEGQITDAKLSQTLAFGAKVIRVAGTFDTIMTLVEDFCESERITLVNALNPFRIEGQKAIGWELMQDLDWEVPDWLVLPGGNLGNASAIYKSLQEMYDLGLLHRLPRFAVIQPEGANSLYKAFLTADSLVPIPTPTTLLSAIRIGNPVCWKKGLRAVHATDGVVEEVSDQETFDAKAIVDKAGIGAESTACTTIAGVKKLVDGGVIESHERVCCILTGHILKEHDSVLAYHHATMPNITAHFANTPILADASIQAIKRAIDR